MIKKNYFFCLLAATALLTSADLQAQTAYAGTGYISSSWAETNGYESRIVSFDVDAPSTFTGEFCKLPSIETNESILFLCGATAGDTYYAVVRSDMTWESSFRSFNFSTGESSVLGVGDQSLMDMTFDSSTGTIYGLKSGSNGATIVTVDPSTGSTSTFYETGVGVSVLAASGDGTIYMAGGDYGDGDNETVVTLYRFTPGTSDVETLGEVGSINAIVGLVTLSTMAYNAENGMLYLVGDNNLAVIDPVNLSMDVVEESLPLNGLEGLTFTYSSSLEGGVEVPEPEPVDNGMRTTMVLTYGDYMGTTSKDEVSRKVVYFYDENNNVVREASYGGIFAGATGQTGLFQIDDYKTYVYNEKGLLIMTSSEQYGQYDGADYTFKSSNDTVRYEYDEEDRLVKKINVLTREYTEYQYDDAGRLVYEGRMVYDQYGGGYNLMEGKTYSGFNANNDPTIITGDGAFEMYINTVYVTYDEDGNKVSQETWSADGMTMQKVERWTYDDNGMLTEYTATNVIQDPTTGIPTEVLDMNSKRTTYEAVDGDPNRIRETSWTYDEGLGWIANLYNNVTVKGYYEGTFAPELTLEPVEDEVSAYALSFPVPNIPGFGELVFDIYRDGILIDRISSSEADETGMMLYVDSIVPNGDYDYFVQSVMIAEDGGEETLYNVSNIVQESPYVELPCVENLHYVAYENDGIYDLVTIAWDQPADLDPALRFDYFNVFQVGYRSPDNSDETTGEPYPLYDTEFTSKFFYTESDIYVQSVYAYGKVNSDTIHIDIKNLPEGIADEAVADAQVQIEDDEVVVTSGVAASVAVYSANGTLVAREENADRVSIANLPEGVYVAVVINNGKGMAVKFVR